LDGAAQQDLDRLIALKPPTIYTSDNPRGLSMRGVTPQAAEYRDALQNVLDKYGGKAAFERALQGTPAPTQVAQAAPPPVAVPVPASAAVPVNLGGAMAAEMPAVAPVDLGGGLAAPQQTTVEPIAPTLNSIMARLGTVLTLDSILGRLEAAEPQSLTRSVLYGVVQGAAGTAAGLPESVGIARQNALRQTMSIFDAIDRGEGLRNIGKLPFQTADLIQYMSADEATREGLRDKIGAGIRPVSEEPAYKWGLTLRESTEEAFPIPKEHEGRFVVQAGKGVGSTGAFLLTGIAGRVLRMPATLVTAGTGALVNGSATFRDAVQSGASFETAMTSAKMAGLVGTSEALPVARLLDRYDKASGGQFQRIFINALKGGVEEGVQELFQSVSENLIAQGLYDTEREMFQGAAEAGEVGFTVGALFNTLAGMMGVRVRRSKKGADEKTTATEEAQPAPTIEDIEQRLGRTAAPEPQPPAPETQPRPAPTATAVELGPEIATTVQPIQARPEVITPEQVLEARAEAVGQEITDKAREDFEQFGMATKSIESKIEAIRQNFGEREASAYQAEYQRLVDEAVRKRAEPGDVSRETSAPRFQGHLIRETEAVPTGPGRPAVRAEPFKVPQAPSEAEIATTAAPSETIVASAVRTLSGEVFTGEFHSAAMERAREAGFEAKEIQSDDGFVTSEGRYVNRVVATEIASRADQLTEEGQLRRDQGRRGIIAQDLVYPVKVEVAPVGPQEAAEPDGSWQLSVEPGKAFINWRRQEGKLGKVTPGMLARRLKISPDAAIRLQGHLRSTGWLTRTGLVPNQTVPRDIVAIIKEQGGLQPSDETRAQDLHLTRGLIRKDGKSQHWFREHFEQLGLLPEGSYDHAVGELIRENAIKKIYHPADLDMAEARRDEDEAAVERTSATDKALELGIPQEAVDRLDDTGLSLAVAREMEIRAEQEGRDFDDGWAEYDIDRYIEDYPDDTADFESRTLAQATPVSQEDVEEAEPLARGEEGAAQPDRDAGDRGAAAGEGAELSPEYRAAIKKHDIATRKYKKIAELYRTRMADDSEFEVAAKEYKAATEEFDEAFAAEQDRQPTVEPTPQGPQTVLPGAEKISDRELAERKMQGRAKAKAAQKPADEGLFDVAGRGQGEIELHAGINLPAAQKQWGKIADRALDYIADLSWIQKATKGYPFRDPHMTALGKQGAEQYLEIYRAAMGRAWRAERIADHLGQVFDNATDVEAKLVIEYLTTKGANPNMIPHRPVLIRQKGRVFKKKPVSLRNAAVAAKSTIKKLGKEMVRRGILPQKSFDKYADEYLPRVYLKFLLERHTGSGGAGLKIGERGYLKERIEDLPAEYRDLYLGEIKDPGFLVRRALSVPAHDMAMEDFLHDIAGNPEWMLPNSFVEWKPPGIRSSRKVTPYWLKAEAQALRDRSRHVDKAQAEGMRGLAEEMDALGEQGLGLFRDQVARPILEEFEKLPDNPRYGDLRGAYVRKDIWNDIMGSRRTILGEETVLDKTLEAARVAHAFWKLSKVPLNPPTVNRNIFSGMVLMHIAGDVRNPILRMGQALREIRNNGQNYRLAIRSGIPASTFKANELKDLHKDVLRIKGEQDGFLGFAYKVAFTVADKVEGAANFYQFIETWGKTAVIIDQKRRGATDQEAVAKAQEALFDYSAVPNWIKQARRSPVGAPFVTFFYKAAPAILRGAARHPGRMFMYYAIPYILGEALVKALHDVDDDDINALLKALPEWMHDKGLVMLWPVQDEKGRWQPIDLSYFMPWGAHEQAFTSAVKIATGEVREGGLELFKDFGIFGGPAPQIAIAATTGVDTFTGYSIVRETDPPRVAALKILQYSWRLVAPTWLTDIGFTGHMYRSLTDQPNYRGDPPLTAMQASARLIGVNIYPVNPEDTRDRNLSRYRWEIKKVTRAMRNLGRDQSLSEEEKEHRRDEYREMRDYLIERRDRYEKESRVHPRLRIGVQAASP
jgi:hypothetical protein